MKGPTGFKLAIVSLLITVFLLATILLIGATLNNSRENDLNQRFERMYRDFSNMQTISLMSETYDNQMACLAFENKLKELDRYIWKLGEDIDRYRTATEEFKKDPYYIMQKTLFNEYEVNYYLMLRSMVKKCNISKATVLFFYQNADDCRKCDDQSFILNDISRLDDRNRKEVAVFSYDMDLNISTINLLARYHNASAYPCVVIDDATYCGIRDRDFIMGKICADSRLALCSSWG